MAGRFATGPDAIVTVVFPYTLCRSSTGAMENAWLEDRKGRIEVFYLPSYAPGLNPDERLNADMKHAISTKVPVRTKAKLKAASEEHMDLIGQSPDRVRAYFQDPRVKYAA